MNFFFFFFPKKKQLNSVNFQATDTSAASSAFVAIILALHPEHQEKVFQEILTVMPNKNTDFTQQSLEKLEFTDLCIRETFRLFPTVPLIGRVASKPIKLGENIEIPADVPIVFSIRHIQTQEKYFGKTANIFDPYRFLDEKIKNLPAAAYLPFSYGPRNCIGLFQRIFIFVEFNCDFMNFLLQSIAENMLFRLSLRTSVGERLYSSFNSKLSFDNQLYEH